MSATNVAHAGKRGNICVGNNVSATMCPRLPVALRSPHTRGLVPASRLDQGLVASCELTIFASKSSHRDELGPCDYSHEFKPV